MRIHDLATKAMPSFGGAKPALAGNGDDFAQTLMDAVNEVSQVQSQSMNLQNRAMAGQPVDFHDLMIQMEQASTAMQLTMQVRNKLLEAYQEINRMQV